MSSILALIPARSGSKGIPNKNFRPMADGWSLYQRAVMVAEAAGIREIVVSSDRPTPSRFKASGEVLRYLNRPPDLAQDDTPMIAVVQHVLEQIPGPSDQIILLLQPTQPFRTPEHLKQAIALLRETQADSVVSVVELPKTHSPEYVCAIDGDGGLLWPWLSEWMYQWDNGMHGREWRYHHVRRQDVESSAYLRDGTVYAFWRKTVRDYGNIYGQDVRPLIIPPDESCELDTEADWQAVERRWKEKHGR